MKFGEEGQSTINQPRGRQNWKNKREKRSFLCRCNKTEEIIEKADSKLKASQRVREDERRRTLFRE